MSAKKEVNVPREVCDLLENWIDKRKKVNKICKPCALGLLVGWYKEELKEKYPEKAIELVNFARSQSTKDTAIKMDELKKELQGEIAIALQGLDCVIQKI